MTGRSCTFTHVITRLPGTTIVDGLRARRFGCSDIFHGSDNTPGTMYDAMGTTMLNGGRDRMRSLTDSARQQARNNTAWTSPARLPGSHDVFVKGTRTRAIVGSFVFFWVARRCRCR